MSTAGNWSPQKFQHLLERENMDFEVIAMRLVSEKRWVSDIRFVALQVKGFALDRSPEPPSRMGDIADILDVDLCDLLEDK